MKLPRRETEQDNRTFSNKTEVNVSVFPSLGDRITWFSICGLLRDCIPMESCSLPLSSLSFSYSILFSFPLFSPVLFFFLFYFLFSSSCFFFQFFSPFFFLLFFSLLPLFLLISSLSSLLFSPVLFSSLSCKSPHLSFLLLFYFILFSCLFFSSVSLCSSIHCFPLFSYFSSSAPSSLFCSFLPLSLLLPSSVLISFLWRIPFDFWLFCQKRSLLTQFADTIRTLLFRFWQRELCFRV